MARIQVIQQVTMYINSLPIILNSKRSGMQVAATPLTCRYKGAAPISISVTEEYPVSGISAPPGFKELNYDKNIVIGPEYPNQKCHGEFV